MSTVYLPLTQLLAGGPGSGCRGDHCGRPSLQSTKKEFKLSNGATYTVFQPSRKGIARGSSGYVKKSEFKGKFQERDASSGKYSKTGDVAGIEGRDKRLSAVYNAKWPERDVYRKQGVTVFVHRNFAKGEVLVQEVRHEQIEQNRNAQATVKMKEYRFRNFGTAAGFLNKKFGIRQALPVRKLPLSDTQKRDLTQKYSRKRD